MSLKITIEINLEHEGTYSETEAAVIAALTGSPAKEVAAQPVKAAAAATTAPAKATPPAKKPEPKVEEPAPAAEAAEEDLVGGGDGEVTYTLEDAVSAATKLVSQQKQAQVKTALAAAGAKRVSELKGDAIKTFMEALEA